MVNYKRVVCEVAVLASVLAVVSAAPAPDCTETHYDQRQNGTDNYRVNIDGVVIAVAPADSIFEGIADFIGILDDTDTDNILKPDLGSVANRPEVTNNSQSKPDPGKPGESPLSDVSLPTETKPQRKDASVEKQEKVKRLKHRLASVLKPLLRRTRHQ